MRSSAGQKINRPRIAVNQRRGFQKRNEMLLNFTLHGLPRACKEKRKVGRLSKPSRFTASSWTAFPSRPVSSKLFHHRASEWTAWKAVLLVMPLRRRLRARHAVGPIMVVAEAEPIALAVGE